MILTSHYLETLYGGMMCTTDKGFKTTLWLSKYHKSSSVIDKLAITLEFNFNECDELEEFAVQDPSSDSMSDRSLLLNFIRLHVSKSL